MLIAFVGVWDAFISISIRVARFWHRAAIISVLVVTALGIG
jgi:hypothetical protein